MVQRGSNFIGQYLSITEFCRGGRKGMIVIPEGQNGSKWKGFGLEVSKVVEPQNYAVTG
jgi:hypothetical protein